MNQTSSAVVVVASPSVRRRGAVRREERRSDRQDVRLSPGSFLQLFPAEVLMSAERSAEMGEKQTVTRFLCNYCHIFYDTAEEQVR